MKKIVAVIVCVGMSLVGIYYILTLTELDNKLLPSQEESSSVAEQVEQNQNEEYSEDELLIMKKSKAGGMGYMNEPISSCGYTFMVTSVQRYDSWQDIGIPEAETDYEGAIENFEYYPDGTHYVAVNMVITNVNADTFLSDNNYPGDNDVKIGLCLGNIGYELHDKDGEFLYSVSAVYNTNDQNYPFSKSGYMYDLEPGESYEGMLVYPVTYEGDDVEFECIGFGFISDPNSDKENRIILLTERP